METNSHQATNNKTSLKILLSIALVLITLRLLLPCAILHYAEYRLNKIPDYQVTIGDIDVSLYKGSYVIKNIHLKKLNKNIPVPFFAARSIELAVEWLPLLQGKFVAQLDIYDPKLNFVVDPTGKDEQTSIDAEWRKAAQALFPLNFNRITVHNGQAHLLNFKSSPSYNIYLKNINAEVDNLRNVEQTKQLLVSSIWGNANTMDGAAVNFSMDFNPFLAQPTFKLDFALNRMQVSAINDLLRYYTKINIKQGLFSLYVEAAAKDGKLTGYAKPFIEHLRVTDPAAEQDPITAIYNGTVQVITKIFENPSKKTVATKIKITGDINNPDISIWSIIVNVLRNAFLQALIPQIDNTVKLQDVSLNG